tara:strand:+ start:1181 stop:1339 length:159 start_codon:yes stop_codon:yes gene_type:complete
MRMPIWVNTPVLLKAITAYENQSLPRSLELWVEDLLELDKEDKLVIHKHTHS